MNTKFDELKRSMAVHVVAQKIADGVIDPASQSFEALVAQFEAAVLGLAESFAQKDKAAAPTKRAKPQSSGTPSAPSTKSTIETERLRAYLMGVKATLQQIADEFGVSKGVAQRALVALGDEVKDELGPKPEGQRGKPPTVYWI